MPTTFQEYGHAGGFILSEARGQRSRENVTLASGQVVKAGQVLGVLTAGGKYTAHDDNLSNGAQTAKAISINDADASDGDLQIAVIARDAEVNAHELVYAVTSPPQGTAAAVDLALVGIIVRTNLLT